MAMSRPRKDYAEPYTPSKPKKATNPLPKTGQPKGMPYASGKKTFKSDKPLISGKPAPSLKEGMRKATPAEKQATKPVPPRTGRWGKATLNNITTGPRGFADAPRTAKRMVETIVSDKKSVSSPKPQKKAPKPPAKPRRIP